MDGFVLILELIGTVAFAASGAIIAIRKQMDVFGVCVLALTTAVGGGIIRDLLLGVIPPYTFQNPIYAFTATLVAAKGLTSDALTFTAGQTVRYGALAVLVLLLALLASGAVITLKRRAR